MDGHLPRLNCFSRSSHNYSQVFNSADDEAGESYLRDTITDLRNTSHRLGAQLETSRKEIRELVATNRCLKDSGYVGYDRAAEPLRLEARTLCALLQNTLTDIQKKERIIRDKNCHIGNLKVAHAKRVAEMHHGQNSNLEEQDNKLNEQNVMLQEQDLNLAEMGYEFQEFQNDVLHRMDTIISIKKSKDRNVMEDKEDDGYTVCENVMQLIVTKRTKKRNNPSRYKNQNKNTMRVKQKSTTKLPLLDGRDNFDIVSKTYSANSERYQSATNINDTASLNLNMPLPSTPKTQSKKTTKMKVPQLCDFAKSTQRKGMADTWPLGDLRVPNLSSLDISRSSSPLFSNNELSLPPLSTNGLQRVKLPPISPRK